MAKNSTKTRYFSQLNTLQTLKAPFVVDQYSTLNEKFNIGTASAPSTGYPDIKYIAIGRGGHTNVVGAGNNTLVDILEHGPNDAALFDAIPFIMVPTNADLTPTQRDKYRIRVLETHNGLNYFAYYLKVLDTSAAITESRVITLTNGVITSDVPYVPTIANLTPTPINISNTQVNVSNGRHLIVSSVTPVTLNAADIANITDACVTKFGDIRYATISELAFVAGFDASLTNNLGGVNATYTEIRAAQIMTFVGTIEELQQAPASITFQYSLENNLPMPPTAG